MDRPAFLFRQTTPQAWREAIARLAADPELAAKLAHEGWRVCAENYVLPAVEPRYVAEVLKTLG